MAKLYLKFEQAVLKEYQLAKGAFTIGRLPDNAVHVDNLAVSGHHARIYWDSDHYVIEDLNSTNGTFVNNRRVAKAVLNNGDQVLIGKHTLLFQDRGYEETPVRSTPVNDKTRPLVPQLDATVMVGPQKAQEILAAKAAAGAVPARRTDIIEPAAPPKERIATLTVLEGKTDQSSYVLSGKSSAIGSSDMASIKLRGWFAPKLAAIINRREHKYFIAASDKKVPVTVNTQTVVGLKELAEGDVIEVAKVRMTFGYQD